MKQPPRQRPVKDERDEQIDLQAKSHSLVWLWDCSISINNIQKNHIVKLVWSFWL